VSMGRANGMRWDVVMTAVGGAALAVILSLDSIPWWVRVVAGMTAAAVIQVGMVDGRQMWAGRR
jgi:hypothetical protein